MNKINCGGTVMFSDVRAKIELKWTLELNFSVCFLIINTVS